MKPKIIKNEEVYRAALAYLETLMDAEPGSPEEDDLDLFSLLIEQYEKEHFPIEMPDPIEAIKFRMDQQGLKAKEMVQYIGSQSKVSEVLNRKRPLSLAMIRALHAGLGIPAEVLLQVNDKELTPCPYDLDGFPLNDMFKQGYFHPRISSLVEVKESAEELLDELFAIFQNQTPQPVLTRCSERPMNPLALKAWQARVLVLAQEQNVAPYAQERITKEFIQSVIRLSEFEDGPLLAREKLARRGIPLVILEHLPHTYLDGASFKSPQGRAVVGMTLRHDRLDNFWFTLAHELAHIYLHLQADSMAFFDDTETASKESCDPLEDEANQFARETEIPAEKWSLLKEKVISSSRESKIRDCAEELQVSPAILAGRIRWETGDYTRLKSLVGQGKVRKIFHTSG